MAGQGNRKAIAREVKPNRAPLELVQATVTATATTTVTLTIKGGSVAGVHRAKSYTPTVGDTVWCLVQGPVIFVVAAQA
jgi:hypothetical protein